MKPPGFRSRGDDGVSPSGSPGPEKICTPIYERDPTRSWPDVSMKPQGPKLVRDRLLDHMSDHEYHSAHELEALLPNGEWVRAMRGLLAIRFAFDRVSNSFRIRHRLSTEKKQVLVELLAGIDATQPESPATISAEPASEREAPADQSDDAAPFDPTQDEGADVPEGEGEQLALSASRNELSLSAPDSSTMTAAILAKKGSGKTYLGMVLAEEFMMSPGLGVPVVIVDPTGVWYGLRSMADGSPSSFAVLTLGGSYGDLEITCKHGEQAANLVDELRPNPVIIDVSRMTPPEQHEFMADFGQRLFMLSVRSPLHLIIDEADEFAPQTLQTSKHQRRSLEVIDRIVRRGRTKGLGVTLISQRPAVVNKNVLSQIDSLFLLNMVAPGDLNAVDDWLKLRVKAEQRIECLGQLANLPPGVAFCTQSGVLAKFRKFTVRKRETFDSGRTPKPNEIIATPVLAKVSDDILRAAARCLGATKAAEPAASAVEPD